MTADHPWEYSAFAVEVAATAVLSPHFIRITLAGHVLQHFASWGVDQRIKVVLPLAGGGLADFGLLEVPTPHPSDWYARWRRLDESERNVLRTYTPAAIRPERGEIDVDFFIHEPAGPASAWAVSARPGDRLVITGPDARVGWTGYGIHWHPGGARRCLIVGDETAFPAMRNIVAGLPSGVSADVIAEVADPADDVVSPAVAGDAVTVQVVLRGDGEPTGVERAVAAWASGSARADHDGLYVWLAGESGAITRMRRHLTHEVGIPKEQVSFLGYWRRGGPLVG